MTTRESIIQTVYKKIETAANRNETPFTGLATRKQIANGMNIPLQTLGYQLKKFDGDVIQLGGAGGIYYISLPHLHRFLELYYQEA